MIRPHSDNFNLNSFRSSKCKCSSIVLLKRNYIQKLEGVRDLVFEVEEGLVKVSVYSSVKEASAQYILGPGNLYGFCFLQKDEFYEGIVALTHVKLKVYETKAFRNNEIKPKRDQYLINGPVYI